MKTLKILIALSVAFISLMCFKIYVIVSGSMEPEIPVGSIVVEQKHGYTIQEGDVVSYEIYEKEVVTHRVVERISDDEFILKGDANKSVDLRTVKKQEIVGKVIVVLPCLGFVLKDLILHKNIVVTVIILIIFLNYIVIYTMRRSKNENKN